MIIDFDTRNCPFCNENILGKVFANCSLPIGQKIVTIDRFSGDERNRFLRTVEEKFGGAYVLPMILATKKERTLFGPKERPRFVIYSVLDFHHTKAFIKQIANIL